MKEYTKEDVVSLAAVAHMSLDGEECASLAKELTALHVLAASLEDAEGSAPPPLEGVPLSALRADTVGVSLDEAARASLTPHRVGDFVCVPRTVEE